MYDVNDADAEAYSDCGADGAAADAHDGPDDDADVDLCPRTCSCGAPQRLRGSPEAESAAGASQDEHRLSSLPSTEHTAWSPAQLDADDDDVADADGDGGADDDEHADDADVYDEL